MKQINFLSSLGSRSMGLRSVTLALTVGSPSAHRRSTMLKLISVLVLVLTIGIGTAWGATTYKLTAVTSVSAGNKYVFVQDGYAMNNSVSSNALQCTNSYKTTGLAGTETYVWTLESATNGFYMKNVSLNSNQYLNNSSSTNVSFGSKSSIWTFSFSSNVATIQNSSNSSRFLGYTTSTSHAYKAYATSNLSSYAHAITVYLLEEEAACASEVAVTQGAQTNGTYTLSDTKVCADAPGGTINVSAITPADCYEFDEIIATNGTPDNVNKKVTGITAATTITVKFRKKTVNTYVDEIQGNEDIEDCGTHSAPSLDDKTPATSGTCAQQHWHFAGWTTVAYKASPEGHITTAGTSMTANGTTYYAVWAKGSAGSSATVTFSPTSDGSTDRSSSISSYVESSSGISSYSGTKVYEGAYGLKLGSSSATGNVACTLSSSITTKTITVDAKKYSNDAGTLSVTVNTVNGSTAFGSAQSPSADGGILTFTNNSSVTVTSVSVATSSKRAYVKTITVGETATYSDYICTCCTPLGSINGSFFWPTFFSYLTC